MGKLIKSSYKYLFSYTFLFVSVYGHVWQRDNLWKLVLSDHMHPRNWPQVVSPGSKHYCWWAISLALWATSEATVEWYISIIDLFWFMKTLEILRIAQSK